jgi:hypothetical protein
MWAVRPLSRNATPSRETTIRSQIPQSVLMLSMDTPSLAATAVGQAIFTGVRRQMRKQGAGVEAGEGYHLPTRSVSRKGFGQRAASAHHVLHLPENPFHAIVRWPPPPPIRLARLASRLGCGGLASPERVSLGGRLCRKFSFPINSEAVYFPP